MAGPTTVRHDDVELLVKYSRNMTKSLFGCQTFADPNDTNDRDEPSIKRRKEALERILAKDQYGDLTDKSIKPEHPLSRHRSTHLGLTPSVEQLRAKEATTITNEGVNAAPGLAIVLRETNKTVAQTRIESIAKSARALVMPWMNSIDKKSTAMDEILKPEWHAPWKMYRIMPGHAGWIYSLAVDPSNTWFASGCQDGLIKIWDLASGRLRITLTGHISGVRGLAVSDRHPYLFSCGDDKMVKCWDLEQNQVVRHYHGHLSGVYCLALHPTENILVTGGRDSVARIWDMRTKEQVHCFTGHTNTVASLQCQDADPQIITGSSDTTIRLWNLKMAKTITTLTHHKKSVRSLVFKHDKSSFASGATDNIKQWSNPKGSFIQNLSGHEAIVNSLSTNKYNVLVSCDDDGNLFFWDWRTGYNFQRLKPPTQPGSIESEASILTATFDRSGARLITGGRDKTIKMFREDPNASEDTHPITWKPNLLKISRF